MVLLDAFEYATDGAAQTAWNGQRLDSYDKLLLHLDEDDAAFVDSIGKIKMPKSNVAGRANVFIFPDIQSGNIGYKIAQYMGVYVALGPILQGLNKPINDLSRGCTEDDIYNIAIITAAEPPKT